MPVITQNNDSSNPTISARIKTLEITEKVSDFKGFLVFLNCFAKA
jgi:hypothetical protein